MYRRGFTTLLVALCVSLLGVDDIRANEFDFIDLNGDVLATLTIGNLPGGFADIEDGAGPNGLSFTAAGAAFFGFSQGAYGGAFDGFDGAPVLPSTVDVFSGNVLLADDAVTAATFGPAQAFLLDETTVPASSLITSPVFPAFTVVFGSSVAATNSDPSDDASALSALVLEDLGTASEFVATGQFIAVPEPASCGLVGLAVAGLAGRRRRG